MFTKIISLFLICLMINVAGAANLAFAGDKNEKKITKRERKIKKRAAKVKAGVRKLGVGKDSVVKVKLRDKTKIKGYISEIGEETFTITDAKGRATVVEYTKTKQIRGNNLHAGVWVAIGVGAALLTIWIILKIAIDD